MTSLSNSRVVKICFAALCCLAAAGCDAPIDAFDSNRVFAKRLELTENVDMTQPAEDIRVLLAELFGTPDDPKWPDFAEPEGEQPLVSLERLKRAAGAVSSDEQGRHRGLYREHCIVCHGTSGNGLGPTAELLNPYPRDFRMGKVKFKSTPIGFKPTREDLAHTLRRGIVGTSMPSFKLLDDEEIEALIDYVIYLSVRGELERQLLMTAATELDVEAGERIYDESLQGLDTSKFDDRSNMIRDATREVIHEWEEASEYIAVVPERPAGLMLVGENGDDLSGTSSEQLLTSIDHGQELFRGNVASCAFCHGQQAMGDGQQNNYDDWTRDWTSQAGLNPAAPEELQPMLALGALKPRNIMPRNLRRGIFRGGATPGSLYSRIVNGIEGTPMPAVPMKPANPQGLSERDVWDIVNYLLSLSRRSTDRKSALAESESVEESPAHG